MKRFFLSMLTAVMAIAFVGCEYDDSELTGRVNDLEGRVQTLEQLCSQMNTNITAMQAIVNALQTQDAITAVTPITEGGKTIGYTITFSKGDPITIYHGQDGKDGADGADGEDGYTPVIGVDQDEDGEYYWTLDGEWLTDTEGNKIPTSGADGADGADGEDGTAGNSGMPQLKIQGGYWYVSYDGGENWERLGRATGYDGQDGTNGAKGDAFFESVKDLGDVVEFILAANGAKIYVPKHVALEVKVKEALMDAKIVPGAEFSVSFELQNAGDNAYGVDYVVISDYATADEKSGNIVTVTGPVPADAESGDEIKVTLLATKDGKSVMASHTFTVAASAVTSADDLSAAIAAGGKFVLAADISGLNSMLTVVKDLTIDLNGHTLDFTPTSGYPGIKNTATLEINDSKGTGKITSTDIGIQNNGTLIIDCDMETTNTAINNVFGGKTTINGGTYKNTASASSRWALIGSTGYNGEIPELIINGGSFESAFTNVSYNNGSKGSVNAGTFKCTDNWHNIYIGGSDGGCNVTYSETNCTFESNGVEIRVDDGKGYSDYNESTHKPNVVNGTSYDTSKNLLEK